MSLDDEGVSKIWGTLFKKRSLEKLLKDIDSLPKEIPYVRDSLQIAQRFLNLSPEGQLEMYPKYKTDLWRAALFYIRYVQKLHELEGEDLKTS